MYGRQALAFVLIPLLSAAEFSGVAAFEATKKAVSFGPRAPASEAIENLRRWVVDQWKSSGAVLELDGFTARTPLGPKRMVNLIGRFRGSSGRAIVITGHYDTKRMDQFVGANDGGSSTGLLVELARAVSGKPRRDDVWLVLFDGEEAFAQWSDTDGLYGSRHLAAKWAADGTLARIRALINVDMIGDRDLGILEEANSSASLRAVIWQAARDLGFGRHFLRGESFIEDDHIPFVRRGVEAVDLIDFDYGPAHSWWHTPQDTMDKLSPRSFEVVGKTVLEVIRRLETGIKTPA